MTPPSVADVRLIVKTAQTDEQLAALIIDAQLIAEGFSGVAALAEARGTAIIKYLAAHLVALRGQAGSKSSQGVGDASESYGTGPLTMGLGSTTYGQQAMALDTSGQLSTAGSRRAFVEVL